jgi:succinyl-diaminopimelate desuccinylase
MLFNPTELLSALVAARSPNPPGDEREVAGVVHDLLAALGLPAAEEFSRAPERPNLLVRIGDAPSRLMVVGHLDTMPPGDLRSWRTDPYVLERVDDRLFGLGAADMKGGIVAALLAIARLAQDSGWKGAVDLLLVADEENCSGFGAKWLTAQGVLRSDAAVIMEPAGGEDGASWGHLYTAQRGSCVLQLVARGRPGHSAASVPAEERAGVALARALTALADSRLFAEAVHPLDGTRPTVNLGTMIAGGVTPFMHPESMTATVEVRTIEGMTMGQVHGEVRRALHDRGLGDRVDVIAAESPLDWYPPGPDVRDRRLIDAATTAWRSVLGREPILGVLPGATDSCWFGHIGIPTLPAFGCGSLAVAHQPNESVKAEDLDKAVDLLEALIRQYSGAPDARLAS